MANRYFTDDINKEEARITGPDAAHLAKVLRAKTGDILTLCDGRGTDYEGEITGVEPGEIALKINASTPSRGEPDIRAEVYIGMAKGERMDYAVQKSVELGAALIVPFYSERTVVKPKKGGEKIARYARIAAEAAKQCGRGVLPPVEEPLNFEEALKMASQCEKILFCYEEGGAPLRAAVGPEKRVAIITGPEGGFSPAEAEAARSAGCAVVGLGPRILRCETAPPVVLAALMTLTGNLE